MSCDKTLIKQAVNDLCALLFDCDDDEFVNECINRVVSCDEFVIGDYEE